MSNYLRSEVSLEEVSEGRPNLRKLREVVEANRDLNIRFHERDTLMGYLNFIRSIFNVRYSTAIRDLNKRLLLQAKLNSRPVTRDLTFRDPHHSRYTFQTLSTRLIKNITTSIPYLGQVKPLLRLADGQVAETSGNVPHLNFLSPHRYRFNMLLDVMVPTTPVMDRYIRYLNHLLQNRVSSSGSRMVIQVTRQRVVGSTPCYTSEGVRINYISYGLTLQSASDFPQVFYILPQIKKALNTLHRSYLLWSSKTL